MIDMTSACQRTADVLAKVSDEQLTGPTPCDGMPLSQLVAHVGGLAQAFAAAAAKDFGPLTDTPPEEGGGLERDWRTAYPKQLAELARAWQDPQAWSGMTRAGGVDLPGDVAGLVALAEVVIHGWDVARASGQSYGGDHATVEACLAHLEQFDPFGTEGLFGPAVPLPDHAPALDRVIALSGRDPAWRPR